MKQLVRSLKFAVTIYNTFHAGPSEDEILRLRDFLVKHGEDSMPPVTISLAGENFATSFQTAIYLVAAGKHLGDMCQVIGRLTPEDVRILESHDKPHNGR